MCRSGQARAAVRAQLCLPPDGQDGELVPRGSSTLAPTRFSVAQGGVGKEGEAFMETESAGGSNLLKLEEEAETPPGIFSRGSWTQNSLVS